MPDQNEPGLENISPEPVNNQTWLQKLNPYANSPRKEFADWKEREEDKLNRKHRRDERAKRWVNLILLLIVITIGLSIIVGIIVRSIHMMAPLGWRWLSTRRLGEIDGLGTLLASGAIGALLSKFLRSAADTPNNGDDSLI